MKVLKIKKSLFLETTVNIQSIYNEDGTWYHLIPLGDLSELLSSLSSPILEDLHFLSGSILHDRELTQDLNEAVKSWEKQA